jgi:putative membrane protein
MYRGDAWFQRGHPFLGLLLVLLVLALIVLGVVLIVWLRRSQKLIGRLRRSRKHPQAAAFGAPGGPVAAPPGQFDPVFNELRMQYARGEIGRDEYLQRAADLGYGPVAASGPPESSPPPSSGGPPESSESPTAR